MLAERQNPLKSGQLNMQFLQLLLSEEGRQGSLVKSYGNG